MGAACAKTEREISAAPFGLPSPYEREGTEIREPIRSRGRGWRFLACSRRRVEKERRAQEGDAQVEEAALVGAAAAAVVAARRPGRRHGEGGSRRRAEPGFGAKASGRVACKGSREGGGCWCGGR